MSSTNPAEPLSSVNQGYELGPAFLEPDGQNAIFFGANGKTAIYNVPSGTWSAGPSEPTKNLTITPDASQKNYTVTSGGSSTFLVGTDDPGAMLPDGNILIALSPLGPEKSNGVYSFPKRAIFMSTTPQPRATRHLPKSLPAASPESMPTRSIWSCCLPARS